jgi:hypothetical protein
MIFNVGVDAEVTQLFKVIGNANYLRFDRTESLEYVLFQPGVRHEIGTDLSVGVVYRPLLINNVTFTFGGNLFLPGRGFPRCVHRSDRQLSDPEFLRRHGTESDEAAVHIVQSDEVGFLISCSSFCFV